MRLLKLALVAMSFSAASAAYAISIDAKIVKTNKDASKVIVSTTDAQGVKVGQFVSLGSDCELEVVKLPKDRIILDGSLCEETKFLTEGRDIILVNNVEARKAPRENVKAVPENNTEIMVEPPANSTRTARIKKQRDMTGVVARGFRLSTGFSKMKLEEENSQRLIRFIDRETAYSIGIGYTSIGVGSLGFIGDLTYIHYDESQVGALRNSGSLAFGFAKKFYGYIGANINLYTSSGYNDYDPMVGNQIGVGFQLNETMGLNLGHVTTRNTYEDVYNSIDLRVDATELGLTATF